MNSNSIETSTIEAQLQSLFNDSSAELQHIRMAVLQHVARYRLSTFDIIEQQPECTELSGAELRRLLKELVHFELLVTAPLHRGLSYWALAPAAAEHCGLAADRSGLLSEPAKRRAYAMLTFCYQAGNPRCRLTRQEFETSLLRHVARPGLPSTYYLTAGSAGRIGLARIDIGRSGRWDRIVQSVQEDCEQHRNASPWHPFLAGNRFEISILTALPQKAARLQAALQELSGKYEIPLQAVALPELIPLLPRVKPLKTFS